MSQTAQRSIKDSVLSIVTIDNFAENVVAEGYYTKSLSSAANQHWWLHVKKCSLNGVEYLSMYISHGGVDPQKCSTAVAICLKNENSNNSDCTREFTFFFPSGQFWGYPQFIKMSRVLAENSGFLSNGALTVQCEVRVYAITDWEGICRFNFHDPFEGCVKFTKRNQAVIVSGSGVTTPKKYYAMKEMVMFHCPVLAKRIANGEEEFIIPGYSTVDFQCYLQLIHGLGARQLPKRSLSDVLYYAVHFDTLNVIQRHETVFNSVDNYHYDNLKLKLKRVKSLEELKEVVGSGPGLDSEMMKRVARKFFSFAVDVWSPKKSV